MHALPFRTCVALSLCWKPRPKIFSCPPTSAHACRDAASLHRAVAFISSNTAVVSKLLTTAQDNRSGKPMRAEATFAALAYTSALLGDTTQAVVRYTEVPAVAIARMSVSRYSGTAAQLYRSAKAAILDARISTTCCSSASTAAARSQISLAVNKVCSPHLPSRCLARYYEKG